MGRAFSRRERILFYWFCGALLLAAVLLLWQQGQAQRAKPRFGVPLSAQGAGGEIAAETDRDDDAGAAKSLPLAQDGPGQDQGDRPTPGSRAAASHGDAGPGAAVGDEPLVVHVSGAVINPGVYTLPPTARAVDGLEAAGGPAAEADLDRVNLAAPLVDGQRLYIPRPGEIAAPPALASDPAHRPAVGDVTAPAGGTKGVPVAVHLNEADEQTLQQVPGIGPVLAQRIVAHRNRHGPFRRVEDLTAVSGIGPRSLEKMAPYLHTDG